MAWKKRLRKPERKQTTLDFLLLAAAAVVASGLDESHPHPRAFYSCFVSDSYSIRCSTSYCQQCAWKILQKLQKSGTLRGLNVASEKKISTAAAAAANAAAVAKPLLSSLSFIRSPFLSFPLPPTTSHHNTASGRVCQLTGTKANNGYVVTFSHKRNKKLQQPNLQMKRLFWAEEGRWVRLRVCARAIKSVEKKGLAAMAKEAGLDLSSLPYTDAGKGRTEWLAQQPVVPPQSKKRVGSSRKMKNADKLAASKKAPLVARYVIGGPRVILTRDPELVAAAPVRGEK